ncbi:hypothetical protein G7Z17_g5384 [Cylindrodendrum hubeiense]|uniref:Uncharacterized protein n=1 Tax=Cylindrodendrum hubeiense TaxID=595255 RepID=A0A9P5H922_9HYPO|nr:hypothetical protein G7Z17_g5384 [Cylindrodendrum hubeiense]
MEVVGAVASCIALAQGLEAGVRMVSFFKSIPEIQKDYEALRKEIKSIEKILQVSQSVADFCPDDENSPLMIDAIQQVTELEGELKQFAASVSYLKKGHKERAKKLKWTLEQDKLEKIRKRLGDAKANLQIAFIYHQGIKMNVAVASMSQTLSSLTLQWLTSEPRRAEELPDISVEGSQTTEQLEEDSDKESVSEVEEQSLVSIPSSIGHHLPVFPEDDAINKLKASAVLVLEHQFPSWLWAGALRIKASYNPLNVGHVEALHEFLANSPQYFPDDADDGGEGLLQYALMSYNFDIVEFLMKLWNDLLIEKGISRKVGFLASRMLHDNPKLSDRDINVLNCLVEFSDEGLEMTSTKVLRAVVSGESLQGLLQEEPWSINVLGNMGVAPIHMAAERHPVTVLNELISAGADIDLKDYLGRTPLMVAAACNNMDGVQRLLQAKSNVNLQDDDGWTALHFAVMYASSNAVAMLLLAGASVSVSDTTGESPVHALAYSMEGARDKLSHMQTAAGFDIEAKDISGHTPIMRAIVKNNLPSLRCLVNAGAMLFTADAYSQSCLHLAAGFANVEVLSYLNSLTFSGINSSYLRINGKDPWDILQFTIHSPRWQLGSLRRPDIEAQEAFAQLYQGMRNRNLQSDINILYEVFQALSEKDSGTSRTKLAPLIQQKEEWGRLDLLETLRATADQIRAEEWETASRMLKDAIECMTHEMKLSPGERIVWEIADSDESGEEFSNDGDEETDGNDDEENDDDEEDDSGSDGDSSTSHYEDAASDPIHSRSGSSSED